MSSLEIFRSDRDETMTVPSPNSKIYCERSPPVSEPHQNYLPGDR